MNQIIQYMDIVCTWWAKLRGKPNPMLKIGEQDYGNREGEELWALKDVSFNVEQGEVLGIIGSVIFNRVEQTFMDTV